MNEVCQFTADDWLATRTALMTKMLELQTAHPHDRKRLVCEVDRLKEQYHDRAAGWLEYARPKLVRYIKEGISNYRRDKYIRVYRLLDFCKKIENENLEEIRGIIKNREYLRIPALFSEEYSFSMLERDEVGIMIESDEPHGGTRHGVYVIFNDILSEWFRSYFSISQMKNIDGIIKFGRDMEPYKIYTSACIRRNSSTQGEEIHELVGGIFVVVPET